MNTIAPAVTATTQVASTTTVTRSQFLEHLTRALKADYEWARMDAATLARFLTSVQTVLAGSKSVIIDGNSFRTAWRACGLTGRPTYKGLHALLT